MKEYRVYLTPCDKIDKSEIFTEKNIKLAEEEGTIWTLKGFESDLNNGHIDVLTTSWVVI